MINIKLEKEKMEKLGISTVFLFGSHAQGVSGLLSDYDFGILLEDSSVLLKRNKRNEIYNSFYELISSKIKKLVNIDIVFLQEAPLQLKYHVIKDGIILYANNFNTVADFKEDTIEKHSDFAPLRQEFHQSILDRI